MGSCTHTLYLSLARHLSYAISLQIDLKNDIMILVNSMVKRRKKMTRQAKTRLVVFGPFCLVLIGYLVFSMFSYTVSLYKLTKEKENLQNEYIILQENADELKVEITKLQDPEYLAKFAREKYLYSKDGELIIKINEAKQEELITSAKNRADEVIIKASLIAVGLIFLYILIRSTKKRNQEN